MVAEFQSPCYHNSTVPVKEYLEMIEKMEVRETGRGNLQRRASVSALIGHWPITWLARTCSAPRINWRRLASSANCYADRRLAPMRTAVLRNSSRTPCDTAKNCLTRHPPKMIIRLRFCRRCSLQPPAGCFRHEVGWLGRNSASHMEEFNAIQSCSLFRTWDSTADRCA
jgi:hypothetical protein